MGRDGSDPQLRKRPERHVAPRRGAEDRIREALSRAADVSCQARLSTIYRLWLMSSDAMAQGPASTKGAPGVTHEVDGFVVAHNEGLGSAR